LTEKELRNGLNKEVETSSKDQPPHDAAHATGADVRIDASVE